MPSSELFWIKRFRERTYSSSSDYPVTHVMHSYSIYIIYISDLKTSIYVNKFKVFKVLKVFKAFILVFKVFLY